MQHQRRHEAAISASEGVSGVETKCNTNKGMRWQCQHGVSKGEGGINDGEALAKGRGDRLKCQYGARK